MSRRLKTPVVVWECKEISKSHESWVRYRLVQILEDNGFSDDCMYLMEKATEEDLMGGPVWRLSRDDCHDHALLRALGRALKVSR